MALCRDLQVDPHADEESFCSAVLSGTAQPRLIPRYWWTGINPESLQVECHVWYGSGNRLYFTDGDGGDVVMWGTADNENGNKMYFYSSAERLPEQLVISGEGGKFYDEKGSELCLCENAQDESLSDKTRAVIGGLGNFKYKDHIWSIRLGSPKNKFQKLAYNISVKIPVSDLPEAVRRG